MEEPRDLAREYVIISVDKIYMFIIVDFKHLTQSLIKSCWKPCKDSSSSNPLSISIFGKNQKLLETETLKILQEGVNPWHLKFFKKVSTRDT